MKKVLFVMLALCFGLVPVASGGDGKLLFEWWNGIGGTNVADLTGAAAYPDNPSGSTTITSFEINDQGRSDFGGRVTGWIIPAQTGNYKFWVASDDSSELWLSTDNSPDNVVLVSSLTGWGGNDDFDDADVQDSVELGVGLVPLQAGEMYYIMGLYKEGGGGDHFSAAWEETSLGIAREIIGSNLANVELSSLPYGNWQPDLVAPAEGSEQPLGTVTLDWEPSGVVPPKPVQKYVVHVVIDDPTALEDPNDQNIVAILPAAVTQHDITISQNNQTVYWRVDALLDNTFVLGDPNAALGDIWSFKTPITLPIIDVDPQDAHVYPGEDVTFEIVASVADESVPVTGYEWFKDGVSLLGAPAVSGADTDTLVVSAVDADDEGDYYCEAINVIGRTASASARLKTKNLVAYYAFEELDDLPWHDGGTVINDLAPYNGNNIAVIQGTDDARAAEVLTDDGVIGKALRLYGLGKGINVVVGGVGISGNEPRSISCWVKEDPDAWFMQDTWTNIFGFSSYPDGGTNRSFDFCRRGGDDQFCIHTHGWERNIVTRDGTWKHLAATYGGDNQIHWYINGVEAQAGVNGAEGSPQSRGPLSTDDFVVMGKRGHEDKWFAGAIDEAKIWDYKLSALEVAQEYLRGAPGEELCINPPIGDADGDCDVDIDDLAIVVEAQLDCNLVPADGCTP